MELFFLFDFFTKTLKIICLFKTFRFTLQYQKKHNVYYLPVCLTLGYQLAQKNNVIQI